MKDNVNYGIVYPHRINLQLTDSKTPWTHGLKSLNYFSHFYCSSPLMSHLSKPGIPSSLCAELKCNLSLLKKGPSSFQRVANSLIYEKTLWTP